MTQSSPSRLAGKTETMMSTEGLGDFSNSPAVKTSPFNLEGGAAAGVSPLVGKLGNIKQKQYCSKFNKDFKNSPHQINK